MKTLMQASLLAMIMVTVTGCSHDEPTIQSQNTKLEVTQKDYGTYMLIAREIANDGTSCYQDATRVHGDGYIQKCDLELIAAVAFEACAFGTIDLAGGFGKAGLGRSLITKVRKLFSEKEVTCETAMNKLYHYCPSVVLQNNANTTSENKVEQSPENG